MASVERTDTPVITSSVSASRFPRCGGTFEIAKTRTATARPSATPGRTGFAVKATVSGSSMVGSLTIGAVASPAMLRLGYGKELSAGALAAGGTLSILLRRHHTLRPAANTRGSCRSPEEDVG